MNYFQTGDLLFFQEIALPDEPLTPISSGVILHSDTTGHTHKVRGGKLFKTGAGVDWIRVDGQALLTHEEHKDLMLTTGVYRVQIVREYDHMLEEARNVVD